MIDFLVIYLLTGMFIYALCLTQVNPAKVTLFGCIFTTFVFVLGWPIIIHKAIKDAM